MKKHSYLCKKFQIMTDKEKIELIIRDKQLNNTQFCNEVGIVAGTLSHIRSGRTEPSLNILRSIAQAFPDINPAWLFYGEEPMYKNAPSPTSGQDGTDTNNAYMNQASDTSLSDDDEMPLFAFAPTPSPSPKPHAAVPNNASPTTMPQGTNPSRRIFQPATPTTSVNVQEVVAEVLKQQQRPLRKVVEVRIFFDDGTFETFSAK